MSASTVDSAVAVVSLEALKEYLKITSATEDALLSRIINGISQRIHTYCGRNLISKTYTQYYNGNGTPNLTLAMSPVTALTSVHEDALRAFPASTLVAAADRVIEKCGRITCVNNKAIWTRGILNIKVVYVAGYALASMPHDVQLAATEWMAAAYYKATNRRHDVQSESLGDKTISYVNVEMPPSVEGALRHHVLPPCGEEWMEEVSVA